MSQEVKEVPYATLNIESSEYFFFQRTSRNQSGFIYLPLNKINWLSLKENFVSMRNTLNHSYRDHHSTSILGIL